MKKSIYIIILIIVIFFIILIYYQNYLTKSGITSSTVKTPTGLITVEQEEETIPEPIEPIVEEEIEETKEEFPKTFLTNAKCINGKEITFTLNNILRKKIITNELVFYAAGYTLRNPVCDKEEINPMESTNCKLNFKYKFNKIIEFTIAYPGKSQSVNIDCGR